MLPGAAAADQSGFIGLEMGDDVVTLIGDPDTALAVQATDPLGLVVAVDVLRDHSLGNDVLDVWTCGVAQSASTLAQRLDSTIGAYFRHHSRGRYRPVFNPRGDAGNDAGQCEVHSVVNASSQANGAIHITPGAGGSASPGFMCGFTPCAYSTYYGHGNGRSANVGIKYGIDTVTAHEMGHMIQWPHSFTGTSWEYDNALDLMSGNYGVFDGGRTWGTFPEPYSTAAINFYAAGWIDPAEVYVFSGGGASLNLSTMSGSGFKMAVIRAGSRYFTLAARLPGTYDPIPGHWSGIEVYEVENCSKSPEECLMSDLVPGYRRIKPHPAFVFEPADRSSYDAPLPHVIRPGTARAVSGVQVSVGQVSGQAMRVSIGPNPQPIPNPTTNPPPSSFTDTSGHVFASDIEWLASSGITRGCNPPSNDRFCPDDPVTRGAMAAFLSRALDLPAGSATFRDTGGHVFAGDISRLAAAGITRGCNPPGNDRFCPDDPVTRGAMAAFLNRALGG